MVQTIEAFIDKLQSDGVEAGREAAAKIRAEAEEQARQMVAQAEEQAKKIIESAEVESEKVRLRTETELKLAARDTVGRLRDALNRALGTVLVGAVRKRLEDPEFLSKLIREVVRQYVEADVLGKNTVTINVTDEARHQLTHWAIQTLHKDLDAADSGVNLQGTLNQAGFEYKILEGTVEVTTDSVVAILSEMVSPELRKIVATAADGAVPEKHA